MLRIFTENMRKEKLIGALGFSTCTFRMFWLVRVQSEMIQSVLTPLIEPVMSPPPCVCVLISAFSLSVHALRQNINVC